MRNKISKPDPARDFREKFIQETGDLPVLQSVADWLRPGEGERGISGLLILGDNALHFFELGTASWLVEFVRTHQPQHPSGNARLTLPLVSIRSIREPRIALLDRLFGEGGQFLEVSTAMETQHFRLPRVRDFRIALESRIHPHQPS